jgi:hypothetical protein
MGRRREGNYTPQKNNSVEDVVGNEENGYPVPNPNKTRINVTNVSSDIHKKFLKEEIMKVVIKKLIQKILDMVNHVKYKMHSRNFKTKQIKNLRKPRNN